MITSIRIIRVLVYLHHGVFPEGNVLCVDWGKTQKNRLVYFLSQFHLNRGVYLKVHQPTASVAIRYKIVGKGRRRGCNWD
uniref:Putative secreted protein n=1 Tax=Anopheles triannulatus TaxID=58253 RepID=A0A2M4B3Z3_9DIPT